MSYDCMFPTTGIPSEAELAHAQQKWSPSLVAKIQKQSEIELESEFITPDVEFLDPWKTHRNRRKAQSLCCAAVVYFVLVVVGAAVAGMKWLAGADPNSEAGGCDTRQSVPMAESQFQINVPILKDLSFAQAKIVDLAWDIGIGHGGRLLHGWVFYHLACKAITWILEYSALRYPLLVNMLFTPDSLSSLVSLIKSLGEKQRPRAFATLAVLTYGIVHVMLFTAIWGAATGYQSPSVDGYAIADQGWVVKNDKNLTMCWSLDLEGRNDLSQMAKIIIGPTFGSVFKSFDQMSDGGDGMWTTFSQINAPNDFRAIYACERQRNTLPVNFDKILTRLLPDAMSKETLRNFLRDLNGTTEVGNDSQDGQTCTWNEGYNPAPLTVKGFSSVSFKREHPEAGRNRTRPPRTVHGWQFLANGQNLTTSSDKMFWLDSAARWYNSTENQTTQFLRTSFQLNHSIASSPGIPYSSTLWYEGKTLNVSAPFLEFGQNWLVTGFHFPRPGWQLASAFLCVFSHPNS